MDYSILLAIGFVMGLVGGLIGIGGAMVMIPAMVFCFGTEKQHLYQAAAMICIVFVAMSSLLAHLRAKSIVPAVLRHLIPVAMVAVLIGVALSNLSCFQGSQGYLLSRIFGCYLIYVAMYNGFRFHRVIRGVDDEMIDPTRTRITPVRSAVTGVCAGITSGLLGIGAGSVITPMQQILMNIPIRRAMSNSSATIICVALVGAIYKNLTLSQHGFSILESLRIAAFIIPTAFLGGYCGGWLMHKLPQNIVRAIFIVLLLLAAWKLLTIVPTV